MSYIVCCNTTNDEDVTTGNRQPNSFTNNFKSALIVEPNSEVAVESVKINRSAQFDSKLRGRRFFLYWGIEQNDVVGGGAVLLLNKDVTKTGVEINPQVVGSFSIRGYADELQRAINQAPLDPNIFGNSEVTIQLDAVTNEWKGFSYIFEQRLNPGDQKASLNTYADGNAGTIKHRYDIDPTGATDPVDFIGQNFHAQVANSVEGSFDVHTSFGSNVFCRATDMVPLSPITGQGEFQIQTLGGPGTEWDNSWTVGVTRPTTAYLNGGQPPQMPRATMGGNPYYPGGVNECYMDYMVHYDNIQELLFVREYTKTKETNNTFWNQRDITYWGAGKAYVAQLTKAALQGANLSVIHFQLEGNEVRIGIRAPGPNPVTWLCNYQAPGHTRARIENCRPTTNSTEWLVPAVALWEQNQDITIILWEGNDLTDAANVKGGYLPPFPDVLTKRRNNRNLPVRNPRDYFAGGDWCSFYAVENPRIVVHNDIRYSQIGPTLAGADPFIFSGLTVVPANATFYRAVLVVGEENYRPDIPESEQALYVIPQPFHHANMSRELGFDGDLAIIKSSIFATTIAPVPPLGERNEFLSLNAGAFSVHSSFVRVNDLTIRSFNGATQSRSQILWHLPKFSNEGRQFGDLYFAPGEKTYIKLHNSHKETINQLSIDIVGRNEQVVQDLTGATIVVLHIRRCHSDLEENSYC